jgi:uncharacterized protein (TIGR00369 family)
VEFARLEGIVITMPELELNDDGWCFACGPNNPIGLKLEFENRDGDYICRFTPGKEHQGYIGITHGGIISTLLDEAMARFAWAEGKRAVTAEMNIRLKLPAKTGEELLVMGRITGEDRRTVTCSAEIRNPAGLIVAEATGRLMKI